MFSHDAYIVCQGRPLLDTLEQGRSPMMPNMPEAPIARQSLEKGRSPMMYIMPGAPLARHSITARDALP